MLLSGDSDNKLCEAMLLVVHKVVIKWTGILHVNLCVCLYLFQICGMSYEHYLLTKESFVALFVFKVREEEKMNLFPSSNMSERKRENDRWFLIFSLTFRERVMTFEAS